ncbi:PD-(D/E)XK motif protein [Acinetobacter baumannii]
MGSGAIETKSTLSNQGFVAKINSLEQLDDSEKSPLFLNGYRFL